MEGKDFNHKDWNCPSLPSQLSQPPPFLLKKTSLRAKVVRRLESFQGTDLELARVCFKYLHRFGSASAQDGSPSCPWMMMMMMMIC